MYKLGEQLRHYLPKKIENKQKKEVDANKNGQQDSNTDDVCRWLLFLLY